MTTPTELRLSIDYAERALVRADEEVEYYTERLEFVTRRRDNLRVQLFKDRGRLGVDAERDITVHRDEIQAAIEESHPDPLTDTNQVTER